MRRREVLNSLRCIRADNEGQKRSKRRTQHGGENLTSKSEKITIRLPERFTKALDFLVEVDDFPSRSEAIRAAIRDFIYSRVDLVAEKIKKVQEAEQMMAKIDSLRKEYLQK